MSDMRGFGRKMMLTADRVPTNADRLVRKIALKVDQVVVVGTPVDTGRARSNWIVTIGPAHQGEIDPYVPGEAGSSAAANVQAALDQGEAVIRTYKGVGDIHIANNLPYIEKLNNGSSRQAPVHYVESAVQVAADSVRSARITVTSTLEDAS